MRPLSEWTDCRNRAQAGQDVFVLTMLGWKREGTFIEIGAADPVLSSNTALLCDAFGWRGASIDIDGSYCERWAQRRPGSLFFAADATKMEWGPLTSMSSRYDYLSLDIDPPEATLAVLEALPLDRVRFSVITYEHDVWRGDPNPRKRSREILQDHGYTLAAPDVRTHVFWPYMGPDPVPFEDWWIDPTVINLEGGE